MEEVVDLFGGMESDNEDNDSIPKNENYYIAEVLKLIKDTNDFPLFIYSMIKTLLNKKDLLNESQIQDITEILNIKPEVKEVIKIKEKIVYRDRKPKVYNDDY
jgi:hypothetical protein